MRYCNSLIIDYSPKTWINDFSNVIISKKCVDQELNNHIKGKNKKEKENDLNSFLFEYFPFYYYKLDKNNLNILKWKNQKLLGGMRCPFYHFNISGNNSKKECYSGECFHSTKFQFNYLKDVIKIIFYLKYNFNVDISIILNLIRYNILHQTYFNLKYYNNNNIIDYLLYQILLNVVVDKYIKKKKIIIIIKKYYLFVQKKIIVLLKIK